MTALTNNSGFVNLDTLTKGKFMQSQRLITGVELLPDGNEVQAG
jgi:hypothetical protein